MLSLIRRNARQAKPVRRTFPSFRPRLEALEDRCLLNAGALDPTFGNGAGYVITSTSSYNCGVKSVLIQPNGDIVAVGNAGTSSSTGEFSVERYNPNGSLDTSFGSGGVAQASFGSQMPSGSGCSGSPVPRRDCQCRRYRRGGNVQRPASPGAFQLQRYSRHHLRHGRRSDDRHPRRKFHRFLERPSSCDQHRPDCGAQRQREHGQFVLARYNSNGSLDTTFGQGGFVITSVPNADIGDSVLLQQPDGSLIVNASSNTNGGGSGGLWDLYCFNPNGTPNTSFGNQGLVTTAAPEYGYTATAALYLNAGPSNDGQIVVVGEAGETEQLARYNANGSLDTTFGTGGLVQSPFSFVPWQAAVDANGRIVVTGFNGSATEVARFNANGTPDTTFGNGGLVTTTFGTGSAGRAVAIYPNAGAPTDGDIVIGGSANIGTWGKVLVARYLAQANAPYFQITGPSSVTAGTPGTYTISVFNPDGSADTGYSGTVHITSSDPKAVLPANFTFSGGTATFSATLETAGTQSIAATDTTTGSITGSDASITVSPAAAAQIVLTAPSSVASGKKFSVTVTIEDAYGNIVTGYLGTIHFSSSDSTGTFPANYTFTASDAGVHTFTNAFILKKKGTQTLSATDTHNSALTVTDDIDVT